MTIMLILAVLFRCSLTCWGKALKLIERLKSQSMRNFEYASARKLNRKVVHNGDGYGSRKRRGGKVQNWRVGTGQLVSLWSGVVRQKGAEIRFDSGTDHS